MGKINICESRPKWLPEDSNVRLGSSGARENCVAQPGRWALKSFSALVQVMTIRLIRPRNNSLY